ncbi:MAG TPA: SDR family oxidoreductase [Caulobacteraceae bacterium]|nr:SDR family oxidoreductase [Caulobacteraceae bacterium]
MTEFTPGTPRSHEHRTYVVTGAASGIGAATAGYLRSRGGRVIGCDLRDTDVVGDLTTREGRSALVDGVARLSGGTIDGIVANAGGGPAETMLALNFFGAVATLEGSRPFLKASRAPRAVMVSSISALGPTDAGLVDACLSLNEPRAIAAGREAVAAGKGPLDLYGSAKHALNRWCRKAAVEPLWAGAGIPLNVVALGFFDTPAAAYILADPDRRAEAGRIVPMRGAYPGRAEEAAAMLAWCVSPENSMMTGQILFVDGGAECLLRGRS